MLGRGEGKNAEVRILNRILRHTKEGIELEADPRHAELVVEELEIQDAKPSMVPGTKESQKTVQCKADEGVQDEQMSTATRARIGLGDISIVQEARKSAGDSAWSDDEVKCEEDANEVEEALGPPPPTFHLQRGIQSFQPCPNVCRIWHNIGQSRAARKTWVTRLSPVHGGEG